MKRRDFLKSFAIPVLSLPAVQAIAVPGVPRTTPELIDWFERNFDCEVGEPRAWIERNGERLTYRTYMLATEPMVIDEERLVVSVFKRFADTQAGASAQYGNSLSSQQMQTALAIQQQLADNAAFTTKPITPYLNKVK
jgi:hypothetical protein